MFVSGFTFIKNAIIYDYPIVESIESILPLCDEVVVAIGKSDDKTFELIESIDSDKIRIIETVWDESLREGGRVLAVETDKAFQAISPKADWAFYIQGDEVIHERYLPEINAEMLRCKDEIDVDGLLFNYDHFYGSYDYIGSSSKWYKNEIRIIKNDPNIFSYRDAQGFRKDKDKKLNVIPIRAHMYHYGWVKKPEAMQKKQENFNKLWHSDDWVNKNVVKANEYNYEEQIDSLKKFEGTHPEVMKKRISALNWNFEYDISFNRTTLKDRIKYGVKKYLGIDFEYKNYNIIIIKSR